MPQILHAIRPEPGLIAVTDDTFSRMVDSTMRLMARTAFGAHTEEEIDAVIEQATDDFVNAAEQTVEQFLAFEGTMQ